MSKYIKIYHGPYEEFFTLSHKPQKLKGLRDQLRKMGYRVDLIPVEYRNYCVLEICGHEVFRCNIKNLQFNTPHKADAVCRRAIDAVMHASDKFHRARDYLWLRHYLEQEMFARTAYAPKDHWPTELNLKSFATCRDCVKCCGMVVAKAIPK